MSKRVASEHTRHCGDVCWGMLEDDIERKARMEVLVPDSLLQLFDNINRQGRLGGYCRG